MSFIGRDLNGAASPGWSCVHMWGICRDVILPNRYCGDNHYSSNRDWSYIYSHVCEERPIPQDISIQPHAGLRPRTPEQHGPK